MAAHRPADLMKFNSRSSYGQRKLGPDVALIIMDIGVPIEAIAMEVK